eukprot:jgi/Orpsp1_1/1174754/evm.model.c7180000051269.1
MLIYEDFFKLLCYILIFIINIKAASISSEDVFLTNIKKNEKKINIENEIKITKAETIEIKSSSISITGNSNNSILNFLDNSIENLLFAKECENIEIKDITIIGNFKFSNNKKIIFKNVTYNGYFISDNNIDQNNIINISDSQFKLSKTHNGFEINNYNTYINNTKFYGNDIYNLYLMKIFSLEDNYNQLNIDNSLFSGNYHNSGIDITYTNFTCSNTKFEKFYNGKELNGGGALTLSYTYNDFYNVEFEDNFSENSGGSISFKFTYTTNVDIISFKNSTSFES